MKEHASIATLWAKHAIWIGAIVALAHPKTAVKAIPHALTTWPMFSGVGSQRLVH
jgi:hypothetical protein